MQLKTGFPVNISDFGKFHSSLTLCSHLQFIGYIRMNNFFLNFKPNIDENEPKSDLSVMFWLARN